MEFTLRAEMVKSSSIHGLGVLILVFVEFTLRGLSIHHWEASIWSLNPCFCGIYSQRAFEKAQKIESMKVLILVFVEFTLRDL